MVGQGRLRDAQPLASNPNTMADGHIDRLAVVGEEVDDVIFLDELLGELAQAATTRTGVVDLSEI